MKRAVIYTRVSRDSSGEGASNARQESACRKLCELRDWEVVAVHEDISISATYGKHRPGWESVLEMINERQVDVVVAWHLDRMTRSLIDLEHLIVLAEDEGVNIATASGDFDLTTDVGRMVARILAAVARAEVERKSERQRLASRQRAERGEIHPGAARPFGYEVDGITVREEEAAAFKDAAERALAGVSIYQIAKDWTEAGLSSDNRKTESTGWTTTGVKGVLVNPRYAGRRIHLGEDVGEGRWPALIDMETHLALRAKLTDPSRRMGGMRGGNRPQNLLTGIARCFQCDQTLWAGVRRGRKVYVCKGGHSSVPIEVADEWVSSAVVARLKMPDLVPKVAERGGREDVQAATSEIATLKKRMMTQVGLHSDGLISDEELTEGSRVIRERLAECEALIARSKVHGLRQVQEASDRPLAWWEGAGLSDRRVMLEALLDRVEVRKGPLSGSGSVGLADKIDVRFRGE